MIGDEVPLSAWGSGDQPSSASLRNDTVLKTAAPSSPAVLALLTHLECVDFDGAPRVIGDGYAPDGRVVLTFAPGESVHPAPWSDEACAVIGALIRRAHDAASSFEPPTDSVWSDSWLRNIGDGDDIVIGHGDAAPWNIVGPNAQPSTLIDWDLAGPIDRLTEIAYAVWLNAQLHDDDIAELQHLPSAVARAQQARGIVDGYGLSRGHRVALVDRMIEVALMSVRAEAVEFDITPDSTAAVSPSGYPVLWSVTWRARSAGWIFRNRRMLSETLSK